MSRRIVCPTCGKKYRPPETAASGEALCKGCGDWIRWSAEPEQEREKGQLPREMLANRALAGKQCAVCGEPVELQQPVRNCELCHSVQHMSCWTSNGGCGTDGCANAPLLELETPRPPPADTSRPEQPEAERKPCPFCGELIPLAAVKCRYCGEYLHGARRPAVAAYTCRAATASLVCGILGLFCLGIVLGPVAISLSVSAKRQIADSAGRLGGRGLATAGLILGIVSVLFFAVRIVVFGAGIP